MANKDYNKIPRVFSDFSQEIAGEDDAKTEELNVVPSVESATYTPDEDYVGFSKVMVEAVDPSEYQKPEESKTVTPTTSAQTITPSTGKVINEINVEAVDNSIDSNITAANIKKDVTILGVTGELQTFEANKVYNTYQDSETGEVRIETVLNRTLEGFHFYKYNNWYGTLEDEGEFSDGRLYYYDGSSFNTVDELSTWGYYEYLGSGQFESISLDYTDDHIYICSEYSNRQVMIDLGAYDTDYDDQVVMIDYSGSEGKATALLNESTNYPISLDSSSSNYPFNEVGDTVTVSYEGRKYEIKLVQN